MLRRRSRLVGFRLLLLELLELNAESLALLLLPSHCLRRAASLPPGHQDSAHQHSANATEEQPEDHTASVRCIDSGLCHTELCAVRLTGAPDLLPDLCQCCVACGNRLDVSLGPRGTQTVGLRSRLGRCRTQSIGLHLRLGPYGAQPVSLRLRLGQRRTQLIGLRSLGPRGTQTVGLRSRLGRCRTQSIGLHLRLGPYGAQPVSLRLRLGQRRTQLIGLRAQLIGLRSCPHNLASQFLFGRLKVLSRRTVRLRGRVSSHLCTCQRCV